MLRQTKCVVTCMTDAHIAHNISPLPMVLHVHGGMKKYVDSMSGNNEQYEHVVKYKNILQYYLQYFVLIA